MESNSLPLPRKSPYKLRFISATANHSPLAAKRLFVCVVIGQAEVLFTPQQNSQTESSDQFN